MLENDSGKVDALFLQKLMLDDVQDRDVFLVYLELEFVVLEIGNLCKHDAKRQLLIEDINDTIKELSSYIAGATLEKSQDTVRADQPLTLNLSFKIEGAIRDAFVQKNWEKAYNKHDNGFRMTIEVDVKSGRKTIMPLKFVRKAALFWTRNPKIPHRIWVSIVKDETPFYPLTEEEARTLLFDVNKVIELSGKDLSSGAHRLSADIRVSWGKHDYTGPTEISGKSTEVELRAVA